MNTEHILEYFQASKEAYKALNAFYKDLNAYIKKRDTKHVIQHWTEWYSELNELYDMMSFTYAVSGSCCKGGAVTILVDICKDHHIWIMYCDISLYFLEFNEIKRLEEYISNKYKEWRIVTYNTHKFIRYVSIPIIDDRRVELIGDALLYGAKMVKKMIGNNNYKYSDMD